MANDNYLDDTTEQSYCSVCGCVDEVLYETPDGHMCYDCLIDSGYTLCDECGEVISDDDGTAVNFSSRPGNDIRILCPSCYERFNCFDCADCGQAFSGDFSAGELYNSFQQVCEDCFSYSWYRCEDCGELVHENSVTEIDDSYYCPRCAPDHEHEYIHEYGYKPSPIFYRAPAENDSTLVFGVELEIDDGRDADYSAEDILNAAGGEDYLYIKHDSSLGDEGMELVTHPMSLAYHMTRFNWARVCEAALEHDYTSHEAGSCGLHIHVGRAELGGTDVAARVALLVNRHWDNLFRFSRRRQEDLRWCEKPRADIQADNVSDVESSALYQPDRYVAVNLCNHRTVEFRLCRGTLKPDTILASLQMFSNICKYAQTHSTIECLRSSWRELLDVEEWAELTRYAENRNLLDEFIPEIPPCVQPQSEKPAPDSDAEHADIFAQGQRVHLLCNAYTRELGCSGSFGTLRHIHRLDPCDAIPYYVQPENSDVPYWVHAEDIAPVLTVGQRVQTHRTDYLRHWQVAEARQGVVTTIDETDPRLTYYVRLEGADGVSGLWMHAEDITPIPA